MDSFFTASKLLWFLAAPSNALALLALLGVVLLALGRRRFGGVLVAAAVGLWFTFGLSPAANYMFSPLEERFPLFRDDGRPIAGVIVLGGAEVPDVGLARGAPALNQAGERVVALGALARRYPDARMVFVGGSPTLFPSAPAREADMIRMILPDLGVPPERMEYEERSRNTDENARFAREVIQPRPGERWLLVTSAYHMPRAMGCFRAAGFDVVAYPVDYRTIGPDALNDGFSRIALGLDYTDLATREWIGLAGYYLSGKIGTFFPAP